MNINILTIIILVFFNTLGHCNSLYQDKIPLISVVPLPIEQHFIIQKRTHYSPSLVKLDTPSKQQPLLFELNTIPYPNVTSEYFTKDYLEYIKGLALWTHNKPDAALVQLFSQLNKISNAPIFIGYILEEYLFINHAILFYLFALKHSKNIKAIDNLTRLQKINSPYSIALKTWMKEAMFESSKDEPLNLFFQAERHFESHQYSDAIKIINQIANSTNLNEQLQYLKALCYFAQKNYNQSVITFNKLLLTTKNELLISLTNLNLARIYFIQKNYVQSRAHYLAITNKSNLWLDAALEYNWTLFYNSNFNHVIGNAYSLQSKNFSKGYMPNLYYLQIISYKKICQYGDALNSLKKFKNNFYPIIKNLDYANKQKNADTIYFNIQAYLQNQPYELNELILREIARQPQFLKNQEALNLLSSESRNISLKLPNASNRIHSFVQEKFTQLQKQLLKTIKIFSKNKAIELQAELANLIKTIEYLEYEIYASASQNLLLQGAQNFEIQSNANEKDIFDQQQVWPFETELWDDELNQFHSKLFNNCVPTPNAS